MKILVTGYKSGLGRFLYEELKADGYGRDDDIPKKYYDIIIHCARCAPDVTWNLLGIPHGKFIYISTVDVYEALRGSPNYYEAQKIENEKIVRLMAANHLILRCGAFVGKYMKHNNLVKMFKGEPLTLSKESTFGFIHYERILAMLFWDNLIGQSGTMHLLGKVRSLGDIAKEYNLKPQWREYTYTTPEIPSDIICDFKNLDQIQ